MKSFHSSVEPQITDLSSTLRELSWEVMEGEPIPTGQNLPSWYNPYPRVQISQYTSWKSVIEKFIPLYNLPKDLASNLPAPMVDLIAKWKKSSKDPITRATLALRFVQDEVRYLGFEEGLNSMTPADPRIVFQRRFGDCKDKTVLLHTLLKLMDISSNPVLVQTKRGVRLPEILPLLEAFDHVILQIQIGKSAYFVDATMPFQGGSLKSSYLPNYHWGLPISLKSSKLIPLPKPVLERPQEITSTFIFTEPDFADLTITTCSYGKNADAIRRNLENQGTKKISENYANHTHNKYRGAIANAPLSVSDDRDKNVITTIESYRIPIRKHSGNKSLKIYSYTIEDYLHRDVHPDRTLPYALTYPLWVKEHIRVENRFNTWTADIDQLSFENESFQYSHLLKTEPNTLDFTFELKYTQDHIKPEILNEYWKIINELEPKGTFEVVIERCKDGEVL
jgi:hypothetical protein